MTLTTRFWLSGVLLPVVVMSAVLFGADRLFHWELERALDRALLAQAAIESVSLFDGPKHEPHLHMATSPLLDSVLPFAPEGVLFGPDGLEVMRFPQRTPSHPFERVPPARAGAPPVLTTQEIDGQRERTLIVTVAAPHTGQPYTLRLTAGLAQLDTATETFHRLSWLALFVMLLALVVVQALQSRSLRRRLAELSDHVEAIRSGDLDRALPAERENDELSALRTVLSEATRALHAARQTKERLLADAAHELRTPLTVMRTTLDLALRRERTPDELKTALSDARQEVDRLADLATRLLDMVATAHDDEPRVIQDICVVVQAAVEGAQPAATARKLSIRMQLPATLEASIEAPVRAQSLRRAIDNLLANAIKFARHDIVVSLEANAATVVLRVTDDGPGIADSERELVFEPFHRVQGSPPGAGLGLAIVREVANAHQGRAYVSPTKPGAELVIELPR